MKLPPKATFPMPRGGPAKWRMTSELIGATPGSFALGPLSIAGTPAATPTRCSKASRLRDSQFARRSFGRNRYSQLAAGIITGNTNRAGTPIAKEKRLCGSAVVLKRRYGKSVATRMRKAATARRSRSSVWPARSGTTPATYMIHSSVPARHFAQRNS
jgi:hypothetical protein